MRPSRVPVTLSPRAQARIRRCAGACGPSTSGRPFCVAGRSRARRSQGPSSVTTSTGRNLYRGRRRTGCWPSCAGMLRESCVCLWRYRRRRRSPSWRGTLCAEPEPRLRRRGRLCVTASSGFWVRVWRVRSGLRSRPGHEEAIRIFASNLTELLLAPPLGNRTVLAIDPGFRTGCKVTVLDPQGKLLHHETVQPHQSKGARAQAGAAIRSMVASFGVEAVAVGNGTAGRETETFVRELALGREVTVVMVNESGASIYSASEVAGEELPDQDVTVRGSVSIGRRLQEPLAELVKIDPKSIGVGQYQHDVDQAALRRSLDDVVG